MEKSNMKMFDRFNEKFLKSRYNSEVILIKKLVACTMAVVMMVSVLCGLLNTSAAEETFKVSQTAKEALKDLRVRKALTLAIDRKNIVERVAKGGQTPASGFVPNGLKLSTGVDFRKAAGNYGINPLQADVVQAKKLLADAGYPEGKNFPTITILYNTNEGNKAVAEAIQAMWKNNLRVNAELFNQEWNVFADTRHRGTFEVARAGWIADYEDPMTFLDLWTTYSGNNDAHWYSKAYVLLKKLFCTFANAFLHFAILKRGFNPSFFMHRIQLNFPIQNPLSTVFTFGT